MAYQCKHGGGECDGCGNCEPDPVLYDYDGEPIYEGEKYYDIDGEIVLFDSLESWATKYIHEAKRE